MEQVTNTSEAPEAPTWGWKLDFAMLKEAGEIRKRDPKRISGSRRVFAAADM